MELSETPGRLPWRVAFGSVSAFVAAASKADATTESAYDRTTAWEWNRRAAWDFEPVETGETASLDAEETATRTYNSYTSPSTASGSANASSAG